MGVRLENGGEYAEIIRDGGGAGLPPDPVIRGDDGQHQHADDGDDDHQFHQPDTGYRPGDGQSALVPVGGMMFSHDGISVWH